MRNCSTMTEQTIQPKDDRMLTEGEVAERWGLSVSMMKRIRKAGDGPPFVLHGLWPRYLLSEVVKFEDGGLLTQAELATRWGITPRAVQKRDQGGQLKGRVKLCSLVRYRLNQIVAMEKAETRTKGAASMPWLKKRDGA